MMDYVITQDAITVYVGGKGYQISKSHMNYSEIRSKLKDGTLTEEEFMELADIGTSVYSLSKGQLRLEDDGTVYYNDMELHNSLTERMVEVVKQNGDLTPFLNFLDYLTENPSATSINELYTFLGKNDLPITKYGTFLAYKAVSRDAKDMYTGTYDNSPGNTLEMNREDVDPDRERTCSYGFHVASQDYMETFFGGRIMVVEVNPRDVVTVPADHDDAKMRVSKYYVFRELGEDERIAPYYAKDEESAVIPGWDDEDDEDYEGEEEDWEEDEDEYWQSLLDALPVEFDWYYWKSQAGGHTVMKVGYKVGSVNPYESLRDEWKSIVAMHPILEDLGITVPSKVKDVSTRERAVMAVIEIYDEDGDVLEEQFEKPVLYAPSVQKIVSMV